MHNFKLLMMLIGLAVAIYAHVQKDKIKKYEFENRTSGGVVEFKDYKSAKAHTRRFAFWDIVRAVGGALFVIGLIFSF